MGSISVFWHGIWNRSPGVSLDNTYRAYKPFTYKELKVKTYDQLRTEVIQ